MFVAFPSFVLFVSNSLQFCIMHSVARHGNGIGIRIRLGVCIGIGKGIGIPRLAREELFNRWMERKRKMLEERKKGREREENSSSIQYNTPFPMCFCKIQFLPLAVQYHTYINHYPSAYSLHLHIPSNHRPTSDDGRQPIWCVSSRACVRAC